MIEIILCLMFGVDCEPTQEEIMLQLIERCNRLGGEWLWDRNACDTTIITVTYNATKEYVDAPNKPDWCPDDFNWNGEKCMKYEFTFDTSNEARFVDENLQRFYESCKERNGKYMNLPSKCTLQNGTIEYY